MANQPVAVLILGGWSPGPLQMLRHAWDPSTVIFYEPPLHMPPSGCRWCATWEAALLLCWCAVVFCFWPAASAGRSWPACVALAALALGGVVFCIVMLVRGAIRRCVRTAEAAIESHAIEVVVGFSWGGGVACWLLAERKWDGPTLLLAPTLFAMASAACLNLPTPAFRINANSSQLQPIHVFNATDDGFCPPSQEHALALTGAEMHSCRDCHIFSAPRSEAEIKAAFVHLLACARQSTSSD